MEKLLVTSNFSFSHSVFKRLVLQTRKNQGLFGKGLNVSYQSPTSALYMYTQGKGIQCKIYLLFVCVCVCVGGGGGGGGEHGCFEHYSQLETHIENIALVVVVVIVSQGVQTKDLFVCELNIVVNSKSL